MDTKQNANSQSSSVPPSQVISCICVVGFHHERGNEIEWTYPKGLLPESVMADIAAMSMPDRAHLHDQDYCYFKSGDYYAVACFRQISATKVKDQIDQIKRSMVQKSVVVVSTKPYYGAIRSILDPCTQAYFDQGYFNQREILETAFSHFQKKFSGAPAQLREAVYLGIPVQQFVKKFGRNSLLVFKALWLEKRVVFYGSPVSEVVDTMMVLTSLMPNLLYNWTNPEVKDENEQNETNYGLPLQIFSASHFAPYAALQNMEFLLTQTSYCIGSSNMLFTQGPLRPDLVIHVDVNQLEFKNKQLEADLQLSSRDKLFIDHVINTVNTSLESDAAKLNYLGSDSWVRGMFNAYTKHCLSWMADVLNSENNKYNNNSTSNNNENENNNNNSTTTNGDGSNTGSADSSANSENLLVGDGAETKARKSSVSNNNNSNNSSSAASEPKSRSVFFEPWVRLWEKTANFKTWKSTANFEKLVAEVPPQHVAFNYKTQLDEIQDMMSEKAGQVTDYFWSVYNNAVSSDNSTTSTSSTSSTTTTTAATTEGSSDSQLSKKLWNYVDKLWETTEGQQSTTEEQPQQQNNNNNKEKEKQEKEKQQRRTSNSGNSTSSDSAADIAAKFIGSFFSSNTSSNNNNSNNNNSNNNSNNSKLFGGFFQKSSSSEKSSTPSTRNVKVKKEKKAMTTGTEPIEPELSESSTEDETTQ